MAEAGSRGGSAVSIINALLEIVVSFLNLILPALNLPDAFYANIDMAVSFIISMIHAASWLLPVDVMVTCFIVMFAVDHFAIFGRLAQWVINLIRG